MEKRLWVQRRLLAWYAKHRRDLPWRKTHDSYRILVSEIMLQQTQVDRVIPKYHTFLKAFPSLDALARAPQAKVIVLWSGLGYNRRARNLHQLAKTVVKDFGGDLPRTPQELQQLPGIGPYTAAAVACFAFGAPVALVDVNVRRVLGRVYRGVQGPARLTNKAIWELAAQHVPKQSVAWNSALMDFGATVCTALSPKCQVCPLQIQCAAYPAVVVAPVVRKRKAKSFFGSNRYWRGRVLKLAQESKGHVMRYTTLESALRKEGLVPQRCVEVLQQLIADKLIRKVGKYVKL